MNASLHHPLSEYIHAKQTNMPVITRSQFGFDARVPERRTTRSKSESVRQCPSSDTTFFAKYEHIKSMLLENTTASPSDRFTIVFKIYDYLVEIREDLYLFGPAFHHAVLDKLNEFIRLGEPNMVAFSERMYEYKTKLLPYIRS